MAGFGGIAAVGKSLELVLNTGYQATQPVDGALTQAVLVRTDDIDPPAMALPRPGLSILLYRVDFNKVTRPDWSAVGAEDGNAYLPLDLHYLLTAWADNAEHEHRVIGRTLQILERPAGLGAAQLLPGGDWGPGESVQFFLEDLPTEDLMRTFDSLRCNFRLSVPYLARIVVIATNGGEPPPPVLTSVRGLRSGTGR
ncbi:DUF4255 domain-containing protein [Nonomuraea sp. PA05]|uniref:DUF4255 domain-containing protein n=1 Tax=Nonomuraea sp. PA05 TaxID=2604466 RepID=UPI0011D7C0B5|nr:DUF4255 domain-containing protein [Nonomuraea sp. PA05]TYB64790.1 DUF4255 domain-containing protein [Nonomuraea sp. PA05]